MPNAIIQELIKWIKNAQLLNPNCIRSPADLKNRQLSQRRALRTLHAINRRREAALVSRWHSSHERLQHAHGVVLQGRHLEALRDEPEIDELAEISFDLGINVDFPLVEPVVDQAEGLAGDLLQGHLLDSAEVIACEGLGEEGGVVGKEVFEDGEGVLLVSLTDDDVDHGGWLAVVLVGRKIRSARVCADTYV